MRRLLQAVSSEASFPGAPHLRRKLRRRHLSSSLGRRPFRRRGTKRRRRTTHDRRRIHRVRIRHHARPPSLPPRAASNRRLSVAASLSRSGGTRFRTPAPSSLRVFAVLEIVRDGIVVVVVVVVPPRSAANDDVVDGGLVIVVVPSASTMRRLLAFQTLLQTPRPTHSTTSKSRTLNLELSVDPSKRRKLRPMERPSARYVFPIGDGGR
mmetsp:Transcript_34762/g.73301  ORF Transcript_34762/g.73301 Transcript_34762/m.73301 type:complete len:209 (+) Transcript_34762:403-1029(+)